MIANPPPMSDQFVPLTRPASSSKEGGFASLSTKVLPQARSAPAFEPILSGPSGQSRSQDLCSKPTVTLERKGETVSGIRIQCGCGQVIELTCLH